MEIYLKFLKFQIYLFFLYAQYLEYLLARDLYPDFKGVTLETYITEVLEGKGRKVYEHIMDLPSITAVNKASQG